MIDTAVPIPYREELAQLTGRELQVFYLLISTTYTYAAIALRLGVAEGTMRNHVERIYSKLRVNSRVALVLRYLLPVYPHCEECPHHPCNQGVCDRWDS